MYVKGGVLESEGLEIGGGQVSQELEQLFVLELPLVRQKVLESAVGRVHLPLEFNQPLTHQNIHPLTLKERDHFFIPMVFF